MNINYVEIDKDKLLPSFWEKYKETTEYKAGHRMSIRSDHDLVRKAEENGISKTFLDFQRQLSRNGDISDLYKKRTAYDWIAEWNKMHDILFSELYIDRLRGRHRTAGENVYFGDPSYTELFKIPKGVMVASEIAKVAGIIIEQYPYVNTSSTLDVCNFLAKFHFEFIRVHPFFDGNGRIARAVVDRLSLSLNHTPVLAGFPRTNSKAKEIYHEALVRSANDPSRNALTKWIYDQMKVKLNMA